MFKKGLLSYLFSAYVVYLFCRASLGRFSAYVVGLSVREVFRTSFWRGTRRSSSLARTSSCWRSYPSDQGSLSLLTTEGGTLPGLACFLFFMLALATMVSANVWYWLSSRKVPWVSWESAAVGVIPPSKNFSSSPNATAGSSPNATAGSSPKFTAGRRSVRIDPSRGLLAEEAGLDHCIVSVEAGGCVCHGVAGAGHRDSVRKGRVWSP